MNKRIAVARDVLKQLRLKRFTACKGTYIDVNTDIYPNNYSSSFKTFFKNNKQVTCDVCALGSAFVSLVNIDNKCSIDDMYAAEESGLMFERLEECFGKCNMSLMESAFERKDMDHGGELTEGTVNAVVAWGSQYNDDNTRLRLIMLNIIRNKGDFKLPQKYMSMARRIDRELGY